MLRKELTSVKYFIKDGKLALEAKDQIKKRLGFSPDRGDALCLTFAIPDMPAANEFEYIFKEKGNQLKSEYDPFKDI